MKERKFFYLILLIALGLTFYSCDSTLPPGFLDEFIITVDNTAFPSSSDFDFGVAEAEGDGIVVTAKIINSSAVDIVVTNASLSNTDNFSISSPEFPFNVAAGSETQASITFSPGESGSLSSVLTLEIEGAAENYTLNLKGTGNYAPAIKFGVMVSNAGDTNANGFYIRDGFFAGFSNNYPAYKKSGATEYFLYAVESDGDVWSIDQTLGNTSFLYNQTYSQTDTMTPQESGWEDNISQTPQPPTLAIYDIKGVYMQAGDTITAAYMYSDPEGDAEDASKVQYQWYRSANQTDDSQFTAVSGATSKTYTLQSGDVEYFFRVKITTAASAGYKGTVSSMSSSTIGTWPLPQ